MIFIPYTSYHYDYHLERVYLVGLVFLVHPVSLVQPKNETNQTDQINKRDLLEDQGSNLEKEDRHYE